MAANDVTFTDTDDADLIRTCTRKTGFPTEAIAKMSISSIHATDPHAQIRAYGCRHCGSWHVGGTPRADRRIEEITTDTFDSDQHRRRGGPRNSRRRAYGDGYSRRSSRAPRERHEDEYD